MVQELSVSENLIELTMTSEIGQAGFKPMELMTTLCGLSEDEICKAKVLKTGYKAL